MQSREALKLVRVADQSKTLLARIDLADNKAARAEETLRLVLADPAANFTNGDRAEVMAYRALALLALGRTADAVACVHDAVPLIADNDNVPLALLVGRAHAEAMAATGKMAARKAALAELAALRKRADAAGYVVTALELQLALARIHLHGGSTAAVLREVKSIAAAADDLDLGLITAQARALAKAR